EPIIQPGKFDGGTADDLVAELVRVVLNSTVDAAIAQPLGQRPLFKEVLELGIVEASGTGTLGMAVRKSGRSSGVTFGTIADISADLDVDGYPDGTRHFVNQIVIEGNGPESIPGDSGSVWVDDNNLVIGLNFAGSDNRAIANHIDEVLAALDINLGPGTTVLDWQTLLTTS